MRTQTTRMIGWRALVLMVLAVCGMGRPAAAQFFGGSSTAAGGLGAGASGFVGNPYAMPMMNPFMNPYAAMYAPANPQNLALYMLAANSASGGIGSGQISGTRPRPGAQAPAPAARERRVSDTPGGGAARYFNRSTKGGTVPTSHYNRFGNYYSANGH